MIKRLLLILLCLPMMGFGQLTYVPDYNFEQALIDLGLDIDLSSYPSGSYYLYFNSDDTALGFRLEEAQKISTKIILNK
jgi:hypothetical protein